MTEPSDTAESELLEPAVDAVLSACDGDARAAVRALLADIDQLQGEIAMLAGVVSQGYVRASLFERNVPTDSESKGG